jgi:hypothetical protein
MKRSITRAEYVLILRHSLTWPPVAAGVCQGCHSYGNLWDVPEGIWADARWGYLHRHLEDWRLCSPCVQREIVMWSRVVANYHSTAPQREVRS